MESEIPENESPNYSPDISELNLQLGDIIEIVSPTNPVYHETTFFIHYIDQTQIQITNVNFLQKYQLNINENGNLTDESIVQINLLSRSDVKGYAKQNFLLPNTWIDIHFGGEVPTIISGQISNLEEDMIEIITYPDMKTIYIDFKYQGIPIDFPIDKIIIREKPSSLKTNVSLASLLESEDPSSLDSEENSPSIDFLENGESIIQVPEDQMADDNIKDTLKELYTEANTITFGEKLDDIAQLVEIPENERKYSLDVQISDMMDELLSTIPNSQRTKTVLNNIHNLIERYITLREQFSNFDDNNNVIDKKKHGPNYKPLAEKLYNINYKLKWIIPIVMNRRKIHFENQNSEDNQFQDVIPENMTEGFSSIIDMKNNYYKKGANDNAVSYEAIQNREKNIHRPFDNVYNNNNCITIKDVHENIDAVVDNLNDFYSSVQKNSLLTKNRFVIQKYNLGETKLKETIMKSGKKVYTVSDITRNDEICIKSFLTLPESVIKFSHIDLPSSTILNKTQLHQNYLLLFKLLNNKTNISSFVINDFSKMLDYENIEQESKQSIFNGIHEFIIDTDSSETLEKLDEDEKYRQFVESIVPHSRTLIKLYKKYIKNSLSFVDVVKKLEPFSIYTDDLEYGQYNEIRYFIKEQISSLKQKISEKYSNFNMLSNTKYNVSFQVNSILRVLSENSSFSDTFFKHYSFLEKDKLESKISSSEMLYQMYLTDNVELYTNLIASILISLNSADSILNSIQTSIDDMGDSDKIKSDECGTKYLSKKYFSIAELQKDNEKDVLYFDEKFDDTPYEIIEKYKKEKNEMPTDMFFEFFKENLTQRHGVPENDADELAQTIIAKKKIVKNNHYAILEILPKPKKNIDLDSISNMDLDSMENEAQVRKQVFYYRRLNNNWIKADDIDEESFLDNNTIFCNINKNCLQNDFNKICENSEQIKIRIKNLNKDAIKKEFDTRYETTLEEIEDKLNKKIAKHVKTKRKNDILKEIDRYRANNLHFEIGKTIKNDESIVSPHEKLKNLILGQEDFSKKQNDICKFADKYCRSAIIDNLNEEQHWLYCVDTNTKLLPLSIHTLAKAYVTGMDYSLELEKVCAEYGTASDDGESIVDKYSGVVLKIKDFDTEEGFDSSGKKLQTRDVMQKELGESLVETNKIKQRIFENPTTEMIYNTSLSILKNINIPVDDLIEPINRFVNMILDKSLLTESSYKKKSEANFKKTGKYLAKYNKYKNETTLTILAAIIHVCVQTAIPSFSVNKTFPNCVRSFSGYPMTGMEDLTGIQYIACVMIKMKSSISPWDSLVGMKQDKFSNRIKDILDKFIMSNLEIQELYLLKKEYVNKNPDLIPPDEHKIEKWLHCLPPLIKTKIISKLKNVPSDFKNDLIEKIKKGDPKQNLSINVLKTKMIENGYGIIEIINNIVKDKDTLLKTSTGLPFLENACCNESMSLINPLLYFSNEDQNISVLIQRSNKNQKTLSDLQKLSTPKFFSFTENTFLKYPPLGSNYLEENIYHAFIHYCNIDKKLPIPHKLKTICNDFPDGYDSNMSMVEKIEFLKRNGKRFTISQLQQLMTIIRKDNLIKRYKSKTFSNVDALKDLIDTFEINNSPLFEENLRTYLKAIFEKYEPKKMHDTASPELENLTNYLFNVNNNLYKQIMEFFDKNANQMNNREFEKIGNFLLFIHKWELENNVDVHNIGKYLQNATSNICKFYPTLLSNDADFYKYICKHWNFSENHNNDIHSFVEKYAKSIEKFKGDKVIINLLQHMSIHLVDIQLFIQLIPKQTEIVKNIINENDQEVEIRFHGLFDKITYFELLKYCFYRSIFEFMAACDDTDLIRTEITSVKNSVQQTNNNINVADQIQSNVISINENYDNVMQDLEESEIISDSPEELKSRVSNLLHSFLSVEMENKSAINYSYKDIIKKINRSKEREKKAIIDYLGNMSKEERKVEELFKTYKLGRWNVGQQKGLIAYDKNTYERERNELLTQLYEDEATGKYEIVSEMRREVFDLEQEQNLENEEFYDNEANEISQLDEDYMDGVYYDDDAVPDDEI